MAVNFWKCLEKRSDGRLKFQRSSQTIHPNVLPVILKAPNYQNSYRLDSEKPLKIDPIDKIVKSVMLNRLEDASYDAVKCPMLCGQVASEIRKKILKLDFKRYKIVVAVTIIERASQSLETTMGFVWDVDRDNYSTYTFETQTFFAYCIKPSPSVCHEVPASKRLPFEADEYRKLFSIIVSSLDDDSLGFRFAPLLVARTIFWINDKKKKS